MELINSHPVLDFHHGKKIFFRFDGNEMEGFEGEPIAIALHANGVKVYRNTSNMKRPRGFFCAIGKCSSCFVIVDGTPNIRACVTPLKSGMRIETQNGRGEIPLASNGAD
jgi:predicted molibdopterin-dependent oxidoreductase YjgC